MAGHARKRERERLETEAAKRRAARANPTRRRAAVARAEQVGDELASREFNVQRSTIRSWRRHVKREGPEPTPRSTAPQRSFRGGAASLGRWSRRSSGGKDGALQRARGRASARARRRLRSSPWLSLRERVPRPGGWAVSESTHRRMEGRLGLSEILAGGTLQIGQEVLGNRENAPDSRANNRYENASAMDSPSGPKVTDRRCRNPRCGKPLPAHLRSDARLCPGGKCRAAWFRARRKLAGEAR
jgi:hypothetical protein